MQLPHIMGVIELFPFVLLLNAFAIPCISCEDVRYV